MLADEGETEIEGVADVGVGALLVEARGDAEHPISPKHTARSNAGVMDAVSRTFCESALAAFACTADIDACEGKESRLVTF